MRLDIQGARGGHTPSVHFQRGFHTEICPSSPSDTTLLPGLLKAAALNISRKVQSVSLFEVGKVFLRGDQDIPDQPERLGFISVGKRDTDFENSGREVDVRDATGIWELVAHAMRVRDASVRSGSDPAFHPGRAATVLSGDVVIGTVGEIHPRVANAFDIGGRVIAGELELAPLIAGRENWVFEPPSVYPPVIFDLAFELDAMAAVADVLSAVDAAEASLLEHREVFDLFVGSPIPTGRKSVAVRLTMRAPDRTMTDDEVAPILRRIVAEVEARTGASLRGEA